MRITAAAKYVIYPGKYLAEWMESYYHNARGKAIVIPHQIPDIQVKEDTPAFFDSTRFNIVHAGAMMSARNPMALANAFCELTQENSHFKKDASLIFLGNKSIFYKKLEEISKENKGLYIHPDYLNFDTVLSIQYKTSVNVVLEAKGPFSPFLPGKVPHCVQANTPILLLGPYKSETRRVLGEAYPYWSEIDDLPAIKKHLLEIYTIWKTNHKALTLEVDDIAALKHYFSAAFMAEQFNNL